MDETSAAGDDGRRMRDVAPPARSRIVEHWNRQHERGGLGAALRRRSRCNPDAGRKAGISFSAVRGDDGGFAMRLLTYTVGPTGAPRIGVRVGHRVLDIEAASRVDGEPLPAGMRALLREGRGALSRVQALAKAAQVQAGRFAAAFHEERAIRLLPPIEEAETILALDDENGAPMRDGPHVVMVVGRASEGAVAEDDALDYVLGVTMLSDFGAGFGSDLGPEIITLDEIPHLEDLQLSWSVNGEEPVRGSAGHEISKWPQALAQRSHEAPLEPGDLVAVAVARPGWKPIAINHGDVVECTLDGVATLRTTVAAQ